MRRCSSSADFVAEDQGVRGSKSTAAFCILRENDGIRTCVCVCAREPIRVLGLGPLDLEMLT